MTTIDHQPDRSTARKAGAALALASALAIAGFTVLGSVFEYPQILEEPTGDILALFREHQGSVLHRERGQGPQLLEVTVPGGLGERCGHAAAPERHGGGVEVAPPARGHLEHPLGVIADVEQ